MAKQAKSCASVSFPISPRRRLKDPWWREAAMHKNDVDAARDKHDGLEITVHVKLLRLPPADGVARRRRLGSMAAWCLAAMR